MKADNFCLIVRKHDEARGSLGTRQTIFDVLQWKKQGKGKPCEETGAPHSSPYGDTRLPKLP